MLVLVLVLVLVLELELELESEFCEDWVSASSCELSFLMKVSDSLALILPSPSESMALSNVCTASVEVLDELPARRSLADTTPSLLVSSESYLVLLLDVLLVLLLDVLLILLLLAPSGGGGGGAPAPWTSLSACVRPASNSD